MPIWGRRRPPTKGIESATGPGRHGELPGVDVLARVARQEGLDPSRTHREGTSVTRAFLTPDSTRDGRVRTILEELARIQSHDVVVPTTTHGQIRLRCVTQPDPAQAALLDRLGIVLPKRMRLEDRQFPALAISA